MFAASPASPHRRRQEPCETFPTIASHNQKYRIYWPKIQKVGGERDRRKRRTEAGPGWAAGQGLGRWPDATCGSWTWSPRACGQRVALRERLSKRRIRELIARSLAERERLPPPQFFELQTRRLSEALLVAYAKMNEGDLAAVDRVVTIVRELDRYHGFAPTAAGARGDPIERSVPAARARGALAIPGGGAKSSRRRKRLP